MEAGKQRVLIFGISGFLGYQIALKLREKFLVSGVCFHNFIKIPNVQVYPVSMKNIDLIEPISQVQEPDIFINAMGITNRKTIEENVKLSESINIMLPVSVAVLANKQKAKFIHLSCSEVFDGMDGPYREDHTDFTLSEPFGKQKITAETYIRTQTMESTILRIGKVMGLGSPHRPNEFEKLNRSLLSKTPIYASKKHSYNYLSAQSLTSAVYEIITNEIPNKHRILHLGGPIMTEHEFISEWANLLEADKNLIKTLEDNPKNHSLISENFKTTYPAWEEESKAELYLNLLRELCPGVGIKKWQKTLQTQ